MEGTFNLMGGGFSLPAREDSVEPPHFCCVTERFGVLAAVTEAVFPVVVAAVVGAVTHLNVVATTCQASQRVENIALALNIRGRCPGSQQQQPSLSSTSSVMASTSRC
uniref:Uncharacterized protein n=1 Tax=Glossina brevipalpis TaxID=37001 RepID=A0A1A9W638_9MUSC